MHIHHTRPIRSALIGTEPNKIKITLSHSREKTFCSDLVLSPQGGHLRSDYARYFDVGRGFQTVPRRKIEQK